VIPSLSEIVGSLYGAWRLARFDPSGMRYFDVSTDGLWRSFFAAVIVAPFYALTLAWHFADLGDDTDPLRFVLAESIGYVISWVAYPLLVFSLARALDCLDRFPAYVVAYNWSLVLQNVVFVPLTVATASGLVPVEAVQLLWFAVFGFVLAYVWFIATTALAVPPLTAVGIVAADITLSLVINAVASSLY
jgi:hypothetical protein